MTEKPASLLAHQMWTPLPAGQLRSVGEGNSEVGEWESEGDDPQFHILPANPVAAGWYRATGSFIAMEDSRLEPCFYPDYGRGISEPTRIVLRHVHGSHVLDSVFHLREDAHMLRFDPMACEGRFLLGDLQIRRLTVREALWLMLRQLLASLRRRNPIDAARLATSVREQRESSGSESALAWLLARYTDDGGAQDALYQEWIANQEATPGPAFELHGVDDVPMFSLVLLEHAHAGVSECLASIRAQSHTGWELLVSDASLRSPDKSDEGTAGVKIRIIAGEGEVRWMERAAKAARGRFVMFVDASGRLHKHALASFAEQLQSAPIARMLYGDEDYLDAEGIRHSPYFKPDWNPELLLAQDYVSLALMLDTKLLREVTTGELQPDAEVYDLALQCSARLDDEEIAHVPRIVRHNAGNGAAIQSGLSANAGIGGRRAAIMAISAHLERQGIRAEVEMVAHGARVRYSAPRNPVHVDIVIPTRDRIDLLSRCIDSVLDKTTCPDYRITVVDNGSRRVESIEYLSKIRQYPRVRVLDYDHPFNYSAINNFAARQSDADLLVLLNNDIEVISPDWLSELVVLAMRRETGAAGAKLYYPDDTIQHAGVILGVKGVAAHPYLRQRRDFPGQAGRALLTQNLSAVTAACLAVRREVFDEVGGLDETIAVAFNDVDFCLRLQARGYRNVWTPYAELYHHESATRGYEDDPVKQARFASEVETMRKRWGTRLDDDPAYSPNLSLVGNPFDIDPSRAFSAKRAPLRIGFPTSGRAGNTSSGAGSNGR